MARNLDGCPRRRHGRQKDGEVARRRQTMCGRAKVAFRYRPLEHLIVAPAHNNLDFRVRSKRGAEPSLCQSRSENSSRLVRSSVANGNIGKGSTAKLQRIFIRDFLAADIKRKVEQAIRATSRFDDVAPTALNEAG